MPLYDYDIMCGFDFLSFLYDRVVSAVTMRMQVKLSSEKGVFKASIIPGQPLSYVCGKLQSKWGHNVPLFEGFLKRHPFIEFHFTLKEGVRDNNPVSCWHFPL